MLILGRQKKFVEAKAHCAVILREVFIPLLFRYIFANLYQNNDNYVFLK